jgi:hypothetical protein
MLFRIGMRPIICIRLSQVECLIGKSTHFIDKYQYICYSFSGTVLIAIDPVILD